MWWKMTPLSKRLIESLRAYSWIFLFPVKIVESVLSDAWKKLGVQDQLYVLVRPDNYIAFISDSFDEAEVKKYLQVYSSWFPVFSYCAPSSWEKTAAEAGKIILTGIKPLYRLFIQQVIKKYAWYDSYFCLSPCYWRVRSGDRPTAAGRFWSWEKGMSSG